MNLVQNAFKYTKQQGEVIIEARYKKKSKKIVEISVEDNGIGIKPERIKTIFHLFGNYIELNK